MVQFVDRCSDPRVKAAKRSRHSFQPKACSSQCATVANVVVKPSAGTPKYSTEYGIRVNDQSGGSLVIQGSTIRSAIWATARAWRLAGARYRQVHAEDDPALVVRAVAISASSSTTDRLSVST